MKAKFIFLILLSAILNAYAEAKVDCVLTSVKIEFIPGLQWCVYANAKHKKYTPLDKNKFEATAIYSVNKLTQKINFFTWGNGTADNLTFSVQDNQVNNNITLSGKTGMPFQTVRYIGEFTKIISEKQIRTVKQFNITLGVWLEVGGTASHLYAQNFKIDIETSPPHTIYIK